MRHRLVYSETGKEAEVGEVIFDGKGSYARLLQISPPGPFNPYGFIVVDEGHTVLYYPNAYGLEFISEPDPDDLGKLADEISSDLGESTRRLVT